MFGNLGRMELNDEGIMNRQRYHGASFFRVSSFLRRSKLKGNSCVFVFLDLRVRDGNWAAFGRFHFVGYICLCTFSLFFISSILLFLHFFFSVQIITWIFFVWEIHEGKKF